MSFEIKAINHITFTVENLDRSIYFYESILNGRLVAKGPGLAYFDIAGTWLALNIETEIPSGQRQKTYTHLAFSMSDEEQVQFVKHLEEHKIEYTYGRIRNKREGSSLYIRDYDGHLFEFHSKTLKDRLEFYKEERDDIEVYV